LEHQKRCHAVHPVVKAQLDKKLPDIHEGGVIDGNAIAEIEGSLLNHFLSLSVAAVFWGLN